MRSLGHALAALALALFASSPLLPSPAQAQRPAEASDAKATLLEGKRLLEKGEFEDALAAFQRGYRAHKDPEFLLFAGQALLKLQRYEEAKRSFEAYLRENPSSKERADIEKLISEISPLVSTRLSVSSVPEGATIWLDSRVEAPLGKTPFSGSVLPGPHVLIAEKEGFAVTQLPFEAKPGETTSLSITLGDPPSPLQVETRPAGADLYIDGVKVGRTPYQGELAAGRHQLRALKPGAGPLILTVDAKGGAPISISQDLPGPPGTLVVSSSTEGAELYVDGNVIGALPQRLELGEGEHLLSVRAPGKMSAERKITIVAGQELIVPIDLHSDGLAIYVEGEEGELRVNGELAPRGEAVFIPRGQRATLELRKEGYLPFRKEISAEESGELSLEVRLRQGPSVQTKAALGAAGGGLLLGALFGGLALRNDQRFAEAPTPELLTAINRQAILADVGLGLAAAGLAGAAYFSLQEGGPRRSPGTLSPRVALLPGGAGLGARLSF